MADSDNFKENIAYAYGTSLCELIQTEDNEAYTNRTNHEQIQFVANQAYGTTDHERIQIKYNKACEGILVTTWNEVYASVDNAKMRQNQAYVPTNPERIRSVLHAARISKDKYYYDTQEHYYEQIITNDDSAPGPAQQLQLGNQAEEDDATYDYIKLESTYSML